MKLRYSPTSPYVRKVTVTALETGLDGRIERIETATSDPGLAAENPLGKVPTLITDDGTALCDSPVICAYLDSLHEGAPLIPAEGPARWQDLNLAALADGMMDASLLRMMEVRLRPEDKRSEVVTENQRQKVRRGLDLMERWAAEGRLEGAPTPGRIALGCALGYLDFRFADDDWREGRPALTRWDRDFAARPSMQATVPQDPA